MLLFGSAAGVWGYNRFGDALTALARVLTLTPALHYVDRAFSELNSLLGFHMKASKEQPLTQTLSQCLEQGHMNCDTARRAAGKCNFVTGHLFGRVGRSALAALYHKAHGTSDKIDKPILQHSSPGASHSTPRPKPSPSSTQTPFANKANKLGGLSQIAFPSDWSLDNGWAAVLFTPHEGPAKIVSGALPPEPVTAGERANAIYFLEAWAALIAPLIFRPWLTSTHLQLCDNEAAKHAIRRGVGKHQLLNCLLGAHWTWHNRQQLQLHIDVYPHMPISLTHSAAMIWLSTSRESPTHQ